VRYLILSDIHANIDALEAVLEAAPTDTWDRVLVLGDLVGYGAEPAAVIDRVRLLNPLATIRGNHDKAACGIEDGSSFNYVARLAAQWTFEMLSPEHREYLRTLPQGPTSIDEAIEICHGAPFDEDHYIFDAEDASHALDSAETSVPVRPHTSTGRLSKESECLRWLHPGRRERHAGADRGWLELPDQRRIGRTTAGRRSARGVRHLRFGGTVGAHPSD